MRCAVPFVKLTSHETDPSSIKTFQEDSDIKLAEVIKGHLGLSMGLSFDMLTKENQTMIGKRLELILGIVANGPLVSLIDCTLNDRDVMELASNRGIMDRGTLNDLIDSEWEQNMGTISELITNEVKSECDNANPEQICKNSQDNNLKIVSNSIQHIRSKEEHFDKTSPNIAGRQMLTCNDCQKSFKSKRSYLGHRKEKHSINKEAHPCEECGRTFELKRNLIAHIESLHGKKKFPCPVCNQIFITRARLYVHKRETHKRPE